MLMLGNFKTVEEVMTAKLKINWESVYNDPKWQMLSSIFHGVHFSQNFIRFFASWASFNTDQILYPIAWIYTGFKQYDRISKPADDDSSFFVYNKWSNLNVTAIVKNCRSVSGLHLIVLIKLCLDAGNDFSIIPFNFGGLLVGRGGWGGGERGLKL